MDANYVQRAVELVSTACNRIQELRERRIGKRTTQGLQEDTAAVNRNIASSHSPEQQGLLLSQKALWFHHDHQLGELGNVQAMIEYVIELVNEDAVQQEIAAEGYSLDRVFAGLWHAQDLVTRYRSDVETHEAMLARGLARQPISASHLADVENSLIRSDAWKDLIMQRASDAVSRIKNHSNPPAQRSAAALVLAIASTVNM